MLKIDYLCKLCNLQSFILTPPHNLESLVTVSLAYKLTLLFSLEKQGTVGPEIQIGLDIILGFGFTVVGFELGDSLKLNFTK